MDLYNSTSIGCSKLFTANYSTSFSKAVSSLSPKIQNDLYAIYGFVRIADEVVDTFHNFPKNEILTELREQVFMAIERGISTNPIIHSFQLVVNKYDIPLHLITAFMDSMAMDLEKENYSTQDYEKYIYGSAEVVGLMCLKVFCNRNETLYDNLTQPARSLGEAFQKVNFLRDIKSDFEERGRTYFPSVDFENFTETEKRKIEADIEIDLHKSLEGIKQLPAESKLGVYLSYLYFNALLKRIKSVRASQILSKRIRVSNLSKYFLMLKAKIFVALGVI
ncbi:MAG: phytoene/squalene synthase family protein [Tenuifilaceae bacterium]|nr:phytoene/squalene synthase family protein [Tenuifilaceae bacterium]